MESIDGLSPTISIEQKTTSRNPRSTVATQTEIYDYLRLLFARIGTPYCYRCGKIIERQSAQEIVQQLMKDVQDTKVMLLAPLVRGRKGEYRIRDLRLVAGNPNTEVLHKESGCVFRLDPRTVYFSPREITERDRLSSVVRDSERIMVMFSGVGPIPIRVAKRHKRVNVTAIELNPQAHNYCIENIHLNRVGDRIKAIKGDVREVCPKLGKDFDRIIMPLPKGAHKFLDVALPLLKNKGILHMYHWASEEDPFSKAEIHISSAAEKEERKVQFVDRVKISQYSPGTWKIRLDAKFI